MSHGFHRHDHAFQLNTGPPCTHSSSGAWAVSDAPSGSTSQPLITVPSAAAADTSSTRPGTSSASDGPGSAAGAPAARQGAPSASSILTGAGGSEIVERRA